MSVISTKPLILSHNIDRSLIKHIVICSVVLPFVCLFTSIFISGCSYKEYTPKNTVEKQIVNMQKDAERKANAALQKCNTNKDILKIMGLKKDKRGYLSWVGSGFIVQYNGKQYLASASHVVVVDSSFRLLKNGKDIDFEIDEWVCLDDSSLIRLKENIFSFPFEVNMEFIKKLQSRLDNKEHIECVAYGYTPKGLRKTEGYILALYTDSKGVRFIISNNPIVSGMSGGVLTDVHGRAIGIVSAYVNGPDHWGMYLPISNLIELIETTPKSLKSK